MKKSKPTSKFCMHCGIRESLLTYCGTCLISLWQSQTLEGQKLVGQLEVELNSARKKLAVYKNAYEEALKLLQEKDFLVQELAKKVKND